MKEKTARPHISRAALQLGDFCFSTWLNDMKDEAINKTAISSFSVHGLIG